MQISIYKADNPTPLDDFILKSALLVSEQVFVVKKIREAILIGEIALAREELNNLVSDLFIRSLTIA